MDLSFYLSRFMRRLHWFVLVVALFSVIGITLARVLPTVYAAEAKLVVESEQIPTDLAASTVQTQATEQLQIIQQRVLARDTLIEMANRLQIYAPGADQKGRALNADEIVADLRGRISIVTTGGSAPRAPVQATLVRVGFEAPTAELAAAVTNDLVTLILKEDIAMRTGVARQTLEFFEQEVARLDQELSVRGAEILAFKEQNKEALPDSLDFRRTQQAAAQERLLQINREEALLQDSRGRLVRLHEATGAVNAAPTDQSQTPEQRQLTALRDQLQQLLAVLSPENPKVKLLQAQIAALEKVVAGQVLGGGTVDVTGRELTAYEIQLIDIDGKLAYIAEQKAQIHGEMERLQISIDATPGNDITLATMTRDYENVRMQYDQAVANKARAETGDTIEALAKGQRISVIEPAVAPREPSRPNRPLLAAGGVGGGLALGAGLVALLEFLQSGIRRPADLTAGLGISPFATLPYIATTGERRRRWLTRLMALIAVALVATAALWAIHTYYQPLDLLFEQILRKLKLT